MEEEEEDLRSELLCGVAGPLLGDGEHAQGEFYVPMATVEGTMLASYNRGMKVIRECGGVLTTVSEESMQRSPVFIFRNARQARDFQLWLKDNFEPIKAKAETSTSVGKLHDIESYHAHSMVFTRFDYSTGDAAGQNMVSRATFIACEWINEQRPEMLTTHSADEQPEQLPSQERLPSIQQQVPPQERPSPLPSHPEQLRSFSSERLPSY